MRFLSHRFHTVRLDLLSGLHVVTHSVVVAKLITQPPFRLRHCYLSLVQHSVFFALPKVGRLLRAVPFGMATSKQRPSCTVQSRALLSVRYKNGVCLLLVHLCLFVSALERLTIKPVVWLRYGLQETHPRYFLKVISVEI